MKNKAIILFMLIVAMVLCTTVATADYFSASPLTSASSGGWSTTNGGFKANADNSGIISAYPDSQSRAVHPVTTVPSGAFDFVSTFKIVNLSSDVHVGVSPGSGSGDICVGYHHGTRTFAVVKDNSQILAFISGSPNANTVYTVRISSTDSNSFSCSIDGAGSTVVSGFKPSYVAMYIENYNASVGAGPVIYSMTFNSTAPASASPSTTPGNTTTTTTNFALAIQDVRDFYARQPVPHASNQSIIYNPDGTVKQVITGSETIVSTTPVPPAPVVSNATATPIANASSVTPVPPVATKTQAPGFEIILAAIGMIAAMVLITRKKK